MNVICMLFYFMSILSQCRDICFSSIYLNIQIILFAKRIYMHNLCHGEHVHVLVYFRTVETQTLVVFSDRVLFSRYSIT